MWVMVGMPVLVAVSLRRVLGGNFAFHHVELPALDRCSDDIPEATRDALQSKFPRQITNFILASGKSCGRSDKHVTTDSTVGFNEQSSHIQPCRVWPRILSAAMAAPQPLSMFITTMPEAQLASIPCSAAVPPLATP